MGKQHGKTKEASIMPVKIGSLIVYDLEEISKKFEVHSNTLRTYLKAGRLQGQKMGTKWYVSEDSLREFFMTAPKPKKLK